MSYSCGQRDEFLGIRLARCQEGRENTAPLDGDLPEVGVGDPGDEAVGVQQGQSARDLRGLGAFLFMVLGLSKEQRSKVAVAKALERPFASIDGCQQLGIRHLKISAIGQSQPWLSDFFSSCCFSCCISSTH